MDSRWINFKKIWLVPPVLLPLCWREKIKTRQRSQTVSGRMFLRSWNIQIQATTPYNFSEFHIDPSPKAVWSAHEIKKKYCSIKDSVQLRLGLGFHTQSRRFRATGKFKNRCETRGANMFGYDWSILSVAVTCYTLSYNGFSTMSNMLQCLCMIGHVGIIKHYVFGYSIVTQSYMIAG